MNEKITQLKKQTEAGKFQDVFEYLDLYFEENPYNQYSTVKMNILHQINMGFAPNPMQVQGLQIFLNSSKIKEVVPIIEQNNKTTTQKTMDYGIEKEIEGLRRPLEILIEKKNGFEDAISKTVDFEIKNSYKLRLKDTEQEIEELRQKIQKLKGENPNNSELKELDTKTQKAQEEIKEGLKEDKKTSVFISYNHKDKIVANKIKDFLRTKGIDVTIDSEAMKSGEDIKSFIEKCVRENDITLSLVSENSLLSAWVAMESVLTFAGEKLANKKFIAVYEDDSFMKRSFTDDALDKVEEEILDISTTIQKRLSKNRRIEDLQNDLSRYRELESNLPQIIGRLKGSLCIPIGEDKFEEGMQKISNEI